MASVAPLPTATTNITCSICLDVIVDEPVTRTVSLECRHTFHFSCAKQWQGKGAVTCPACRGKSAVLQFLKTKCPRKKNGVSVVSLKPLSSYEENKRKMALLEGAKASRRETSNVIMLEGAPPPPLTDERAPHETLCEYYYNGDMSYFTFDVHSSQCNVCGDDATNHPPVLFANAFHSHTMCFKCLGEAGVIRRDAGVTQCAVCLLKERDMK